MNDLDKKTLTKIRKLVAEHINTEDMLELLDRALGKVKTKPKTKFNIPTLEEVQAYCKERNSLIDPGQFCDHYTSNGWMVGKNKMKDWKAAVSLWERRQKEKDSVPQKDVRARAIETNEQQRRETFKQREEEFEPLTEEEQANLEEKIKGLQQRFNMG